MNKINAHVFLNIPLTLLDFSHTLLLKTFTPCKNKRTKHLSTHRQWCSFWCISLFPINFTINLKIFHFDIIPWTTLVRVSGMCLINSILWLVKLKQHIYCAGALALSSTQVSHSINVSAATCLMLTSSHHKSYWSYCKLFPFLQSCMCSRWIYLLNFQKLMYEK